MEGIPVATCIIDAHASLPGCGIGEPGKMMIIVGTSSVHMMLGEKEVGENVTIVGGGLTGCEIAYDLYQQGEETDDRGNEERSDCGERSLSGKLQLSA